MKILQVIPYFAPKRGGNVNSVYNLSNQLVKRGHEVTIITTDFEFDKDYAESLKRVQVILFKCIINIDLFISPSMKKWLKRNIKDYDIIHMNSFRHYQNIVVHHYAKKCDIPYILQPRGSVPTISKSKRKKLFDTFWGRAIIKDAKKVIATSKIESEQYRTIFPNLDSDKIVHVPNGIDLETYQNLPQKGQFRKKYSIDDKQKIILFLSRIHKKKGADILVKAFSKLKNEFENVKLVIAGPDDGYLDKLKSIVSKLNIESTVIFTGPLYEKDKMEAYVDADVFVLPSSSEEESFGNVALESLACGTPVIVTNKCGVSEWITDDVSYVVECGKDQLRDALFKLLSDEGLRKRFGEGGRKLVLEEFGWNGIVRKMEVVYEDCIRG